MRYGFAIRNVIVNILGNSRMYQFIYNNLISENDNYKPVNYSEDPVVYLRINDLKNVRLLAITDLHFHKNASDKMKTKTNITNLLKEYNDVDAIIITGDLWFDNKNDNGLLYMSEAISFFDSLKLPWIFVWGNHDKLTDYELGHKLLVESKYGLYGGDKSDGNYIVRIVSNKGKHIWNFFIINSGRKGIQETQQNWLRSNIPISNNISSFAFFHIPIIQYQEAWDNQINRNKEFVKYEFIDSRLENGKTLSILKELGGICCFCGHEHLNCYSGHVDGIHLNMLRSTGGYGNKLVSKGASVIQLNCSTETYSYETIVFDQK